MLVFLPLNAEIGRLGTLPIRGADVHRVVSKGSASRLRAALTRAGVLGRTRWSVSAMPIRGRDTDIDQRGIESEGLTEGNHHHLDQDPGFDDHCRHQNPIQGRTAPALLELW